MSPKISIKLTRYGQAGWEVSAHYTDDHGEVIDRRWRTNGRGEGCWFLRNLNALRDAKTGERIFTWAQVYGTGQYSLPTSRRAAYAAVRREIMRVGQPAR